METSALRDALRQVVDPELGLDIVELGLVCGLTVTGTRVEVVMTTTSPACPLGQQLAREVEAVIRRAAPRVDEVQVRVVFDPPWRPALMSEQAKRWLGWDDRRG